MPGLCRVNVSFCSCFHFADELASENSRLPIPLQARPVLLTAKNVRHLQGHIREGTKEERTVLGVC